MTDIYGEKWCPLNQRLRENLICDEATAAAPKAIISQSKCCVHFGNEFKNCIKVKYYLPLNLGNFKFYSLPPLFLLFQWFVRLK